MYLENTHSSDSTNLRINETNKGSLQERIFTKCNKPIFIVLIILGFIGIGIATFGVHQNWWAAGALSHLGQIQAIIMMTVGGGGGIVFLIVGIVGTVKTHRKKTESETIFTNLIEEVLTPLISLEIKNSSISLDTSYDRQDDKGILDLVFCDSSLGFGCVVDGTGHSNPNMQGPLKTHFEPFIENYKKDQSNSKAPTTLEELTHYFEKKMNSLNQQFKDYNLPQNKIKVCPSDKIKAYENEATLGTFLDPTYKPAMSFAQLVRIEDKLILLTAQAGDSMIVVEMQSGELRKTQNKSHQGVGDYLSVKSFDITGAKRIIGLSDGIGEFMTFDELKEVITTTESDELSSKLKEKAMSNRPIDRNTDAANGANIKIYYKNLVNTVLTEKIIKDHSDDISLFVLDII